MAKEYTSKLSLSKTPFDPHRCKAACPTLSRLFFDQCSRKPKANGWCWQHDPKWKAANRREAEGRAYETQIAESAARMQTAVVLRRQLAEATAQRDNALEVLGIAVAALHHEVPVDCWSTGPLSGTIADTLCPGCHALAQITKVKGEK